jgi:hypothetical protein
VESWVKEWCQKFVTFMSLLIVMLLGFLDVGAQVLGIVLTQYIGLWIFLSPEKK